MAMVPRAGLSPFPSSLSNARSGPPTRVVTTSSSRSSVEGLPAGEGVAFDSATYGYFDEPASFDRRGQGGERRGLNKGLRGLNAPSQAFAAMLENGVAGSDNSDGTRNQNFSPSPGYISKVINVYETNARIVGGEINILGTTVSMVL